MQETQEFGNRQENNINKNPTTKFQSPPPNPPRNLQQSIKEMRGISSLPQKA